MPFVVFVACGEFDYLNDTTVLRLSYELRIVDSYQIHTRALISSYSYAFGKCKRDAHSTLRIPG
jgi:hypothetical protein